MAIRKTPEAQAAPPKPQARGADGLTVTQREFVRLYCRGVKMPDAWARAYGYEIKTSFDRVRARDKAATELRKTRVKAAIDNWRAEVADALQRSAVEYSITRESLSNVLATIAFCGGILRQPDTIDPKTGEVVPGPTRTVSIRDIRNAVMDLAALHGLIIERKQVRLIRSIQDLTDDELKAIAAEESQEDDER